MALTNVSASQARDGLVNSAGTRWSGTITYSVPAAGAVWGSSYGSNEPRNAYYSVFSTQQATDFSAAIEAWDALIAPVMNRVSDSTPGHIRAAFTDVSRQGPNVAGYAYGPSSAGASAPAVAGDIWIDDSLRTSSFARGTQGHALLLHEAGHALGLKHPFENTRLPAAYDSKTYTIMSYTDEDFAYRWSGGGGSISYSVSGTPVLTPMVLDIQAIQALYGADTATGAGNTVYSFTDATVSGRQAIHDASGIDTLNLAALTRGSTVDMRPGAYSDLAYYSVAAQIADLTAQYGSGFGAFIRSAMSSTTRPAYEWERNLGLAFSTVIENVVGSAHADTIIGNSAANTINGGAGADRMTGLTGNDIYYVDNVGDVVVEAAGGGTDRVLAARSYGLAAAAEVETMSTTLTSGTGAINLTGNGFAQSVLGNQGINTLLGLGGNDTLFGYGGKDTLVGGLGNDTFVFDTALGATNIDIVRDFHNVTADNDTIRLENGIFTKLLATGALLAANFKANATGTATDANDHIVYNTVTGAVIYDSNGNAAGGAVQFATLTDHPALTAADFFVV